VTMGAVVSADCVMAAAAKNCKGKKNKSRCRTVQGQQVHNHQLACGVGRGAGCR
jgi:hypothetical protein